MKDGFIKIAAVTPKIRVADVDYNTKEVIRLFREAAGEGAKIIVFPELVLTGYTCNDLFLQSSLLREAGKGLREVIRASEAIRALVFVGLPLEVDGRLYNTAAALCGGKLLGFVPKRAIPNYSEYYEQRYFAPGNGRIVPVLFDGREVPFGAFQLFECRTPEAEGAVPGGIRVACEICEDLWAPIPPSSVMTLAGAEVIVNISASNELIAKRDYRKNLVKQTSASEVCEYLYVSAGCGESTQDVVFSGHSLIAENGSILNENRDYIATDYLLVADMDLGKIRSERARMKSFGDAAAHYRALTARCRMITETAEKLPESSGEYYILQKHPFVPASRKHLEKRCSDIFDMQVGGLAKRLEVTGSKPVIGVSGGMDSTLALLVAAKALQKLGRPASDLVAITMPAFGTSNRTYENSLLLIKSLGTTPVIIDIKAACIQHLADLGHDQETKDITYENTQARERTQILMDYANMCGGLVVGTGDLSELALGWCTYNGDHMAMYGVNGSIPKTLVRWMIDTVAETGIFPDSTVVLRDILDTPISPELLPPDEFGQITQKTEDSVGPYELHDFFLFYTLRYGYSPAKINYLANRAFEKDYDRETILKWQKMFTCRFFSQQFKRSCMPDGVKVGSVALSPRGDWRMPSDACVASWIAELDLLEV